MSEPSTHESVPQGRESMPQGHSVSGATVAVTSSSQPHRDVAAITTGDGAFRMGGMGPASARRMPEGGGGWLFCGVDRLWEPVDRRSTYRTLGQGPSLNRLCSVRRLRPVRLENTIVFLGEHMGRETLFLKLF